MNTPPPQAKASAFYLWLSLAGFLLMALFWGLGKTFIVIFGAVGVGSALVYYFQWQETRPHPFQQRSQTRTARAAQSQRPSVPPAGMINRLIGFVVIGIVGVFFIYQIFSEAEEDTPLVEETEEVGVEASEEEVVETRAQRADALYAEADYQAALPLYLQELEKNPTDETMLINVGNCYYGLGQLDAADGYYQQALSAHPQSTSGLHNRALVQYDKKNYREAIVFLNRGLAIDDTYGPSWDLLGNCYYDQERYTDAKPCYEKAFARDVRYIGLYEKLGFLEERANNITKAKEYYEEGLLYDASSTYIQERLKALGQ